MLPTTLVVGSIKTENTSTLKTMDSREISELTNKRHDNVIRDIQAQIVDHLKFEAVYLSGNNKNGRIYV